MFPEKIVKDFLSPLGIIFYPEIPKTNIKKFPSKIQFKFFENFSSRKNIASFFWYPPLLRFRGQNSDFGYQKNSIENTDLISPEFPIIAICRGNEAIHEIAPFFKDIPVYGRRAPESRLTETLVTYKRYNLPVYPVRCRYIISMWHAVRLLKTVFLSLQ